MAEDAYSYCTRSIFLINLSYQMMILLSRIKI
nr:MAG TPA: hypothetical protein [Caudoviricetes sp.]